MAKNTELVFILDKSGSMGGLEEDTIGGYNSFLKKQQELADETRITTVLFDNNYELLHDRLDLKAVSAITKKDYFVGGSTALLDAIGKTIHKVENVQKRSGKKYKPTKILFVITTDGMENSSREYSFKKIKAIVESKKEEGWEFIFLGANIDAIDVAGNIGIAPNRAAKYFADSKGLDKVFDVVGSAVSNFCITTADSLNDDWAEEIEKDYAEREKEKN